MAPPPSQGNTNVAPTASAGENISVFGVKKVTLDGSLSEDEDGTIVKYVWSEGTKELGQGKVLENLTFEDGTHDITLTVTDNDGAKSVDNLRLTAKCTQAESVELTKDAEGTVNYSGANEKSLSCYKINLSSNNSIETYMFYVNLYNGTRHNVSHRGSIKLFDDNGALKKTFYTNFIYKTGSNLKEAFEIESDGDYYIIMSRISDAMKYGFSIHPSLENGLLQDKNNELNDNFQMATPVTLDVLKNDVNGTINMSRNDNNSLRHTDNEDYYSMTFTKAGTYTLYVNLYNGTRPNVSYYTSLKLYNENYALEYTFSSKLYKDGSRLRESFDISIPGKYYFRIFRRNHEATRYGFSIHPSIKNGLMQDEDRELNDNISMAAPISWSDIGKGITGSVNKTRIARDSSTQNTDNIDFYAIDFNTTGEYILDLNLTTGTRHNVSHYFYSELYDEDGTSVQKFGGKLYKSGQNLNTVFTIPTVGKYYFSLYRISDAAKYGFTMEKK